MQILSIWYFPLMLEVNSWPKQKQLFLFYYSIIIHHSSVFHCHVVRDKVAKTTQKRYYRCFRHCHYQLENKCSRGRILSIWKNEKWNIFQFGLFNSFLQLQFVDFSVWHYTLNIMHQFLFIAYCALQNYRFCILYETDDKWMCGVLNKNNYF